MQATAYDLPPTTGFELYSQEYASLLDTEVPMPHSYSNPARVFEQLPTGRPHRSTFVPFVDTVSAECYAYDRQLATAASPSICYSPEASQPRGSLYQPRRSLASLAPSPFTYPHSAATGPRPHIAYTQPQSVSGSSPQTHYARQTDPSSPIALPHVPVVPPLAAPSISSTRASGFVIPQTTSENLFQTPVQLLGELAETRRRQVSHPLPSCHDSEPNNDSIPEARDASVSSGASDEGDTEEKPRRSSRNGSLTDVLGFPATDPDSVTAHDKKRNYLECLEQYVQYLQEQSRLAGRFPLPLIRVNDYKGISSRSARTMLVHMQNMNRTLHRQVLQEEQRFIDLHDQVLALHQHTDD